MRAKSVRFRASCLAAFITCVASCKSGVDERAIILYAEAAAAYDRGAFLEARGAAEHALRYAPKFLPALALAGKAAYLCGDAEGAAKALVRGVKASPRGGEAALWLARAYRAAGKADEARRACESLLAAAPFDAAALRLASSLAMDRDKPAEARAFLDRAVAASAESGLAFLDRACLRWAGGDRAGCLADLRTALAVLPEGSAAYRATISLLTEIEALP